VALRLSWRPALLQHRKIESFAQGALLVGLAVVALACGDPVQDAAVAALGGESAGVPVGPNHRPGQPCNVCHTPGGVGKPAFTVAGTIYREKGRPAVLGNVDVLLTDATGRSKTLRSNCAGNFYVEAEQFTPQSPFWVSLAYAGQRIDMESPIFREGSCAGCHSEPASPRSAGAVFMTDEPEKAALFPSSPCVD
jgi:hypothetical protein